MHVLKVVFYYCPPYYLEYGSKTFLSNGSYPKFFYPMFADCVHTKTMFVHVSQYGVFLINCSKFVVEEDWNSKNAQNVQNLFFFLEKKMGFFDKNLRDFSKSLKVAISSRMRLKWHCFIKISFHLIFEVFWLGIKKIRVGKIRKYDEETEYFE